MYWHYFKCHNSYQVEIIIIMTIIIINIVSDCGHRVGFSSLLCVTRQKGL